MIRPIVKPLAIGVALIAIFILLIINTIGLNFVENSRSVNTVLFCLFALSACLYVQPFAIKYQIHVRSVKILNAAAFAILISLIVLRDIYLFIEPRFWAEELTVYFKTAYIESVWLALIAPHQGYFSLWANLAGLLATIPSIEHAPAVTTGMSALVLIMIILVILVNQSAGLNSTLKKAVAGLVVLVVGTTGEIWLTSINSQHFLPLLVYLILIDDKREHIKRRVWFCVTAIAGLSSVAVNFLIPLFWLRYKERRERADLVLFVILVSTAMIQLAYIAYSLFVLGDTAYYHSATQRRILSDFSVIEIARNIFHYAIEYPTFGNSGLLSSVGAAALLLLYYFARNSWRDHWMALGAVFLLTSLSIISSIGMQGGPRYAYSSSAIVMLVVLALCFDFRLSQLVRVFSSTILTASLAYWSTQFFTKSSDFRDPQWPSWSDEVKAWRLNPSKKLQAHPVWESQSVLGLVWSIELPPK